jgi:hypothetical protein
METLVEARPRTSPLSVEPDDLMKLIYQCQAGRKAERPALKDLVAICEHNVRIRTSDGPRLSLGSAYPGHEVEVVRKWVQKYMLNAST